LGPKKVIRYRKNRRRDREVREIDKRENQWRQHAQEPSIVQRRTLGVRLEK